MKSLKRGRGVVVGGFDYFGYFDLENYNCSGQQGGGGGAGDAYLTAFSS